MPETEQRLRAVEIGQAEHTLLMQDLAETVKETHKAVFSTSMEAPGIAMRVAHQEAITRNAMRFLVWTFGGGLTAVGGTLVFLWQILRAVQHLPPAGQ